MTLEKSDCDWMYIEKVRHKATLKANTTFTPKDMIWIRTLSIPFRTKMSDTRLHGQKDSSLVNIWEVWLSNPITWFELRLSFFTQKYCRYTCRLISIHLQRFAKWKRANCFELRCKSYGKKVYLRLSVLNVMQITETIYSDVRKEDQDWGWIGVICWWQGG
jgi:hypothetical protein